MLTINWNLARNHGKSRFEAWKIAKNFILSEAKYLELIFPNEHRCHRDDIYVIVIFTSKEENNTKDKMYKLIRSFIPSLNERINNV